MNMYQTKTIVAATFAVALVGFAGSAHADTVDEINKISQAKVDAGQSSQKRVSRLAEDTYDRFQDYRTVLKQIEGLKVHNARLDKVLGDQQKRINQYEANIADVAVISRQMIPLAERMLDKLEQFVSADVPFRSEERKDRLTDLRANLDSSKLNDSEKFRQVLEAYSIENEYGTKIDTYEGKVDDLAVDMLQMGRLALIYQTKDQKVTGAWDQSAGAWVELDNGAYKAAVRKGIRIANNQAVKDIMVIPVPAPEAGK